MFFWILLVASLVCISFNPFLGFTLLLIAFIANTRKPYSIKTAIWFAVSICLIILGFSFPILLMLVACLILWLSGKLGINNG